MAIKTTGIIVRINGTDIGDVQSLGDIKLSRNTKEYAALNSEDVLIAVGRAQTGDFPIKVLLNPDDTAAQGALRSALKDGNTITLEIELPNKKSDDGHGTKYTWDGAVVYEESITPEEDGFLLANFSVKTPGFPVVTAAS